MVSTGDAIAMDEATVREVATAVAAFVKSLRDFETENASQADAIHALIRMVLNFILLGFDMECSF